MWLPLKGDSDLVSRLCCRKRFKAVCSLNTTGVFVCLERTKVWAGSAPVTSLPAVSISVVEPGHTGADPCALGELTDSIEAEYIVVS